MSRPRIFVEAARDTDRLVLEGAEHHYLTRVRRLAVGATVEVVTPSGIAALYEIAGATGEQVVLVREGPLPSRRLPGLLTLIQPLLARRKLELAVQKATELGADRIRLLVADRAVARWEPGERGTRLERLERIVLEASRQSRRDQIPVLDIIERVEDLGASPTGESRFLLTEDTDPDATSLAALALGEAAPRVTVAVGPEGGYRQSEVDAMRAAGFVALHLGPLVLRTETASAVACVAGGLALGRFNG